MERLVDLLEKASQATGVAVEQVYQILIQQSKVELIWNTLGIIAILVILAICYTVAYKMYKKERKYSEYRDYTGAIMTAIIPTIFGGLFSTIAVVEIVQILVNPQVWVLEYLIKMFQ